MKTIPLSDKTVEALKKMGYECTNHITVSDAAYKEIERIRAQLEVPGKPPVSDEDILRLSFAMLEIMEEPNAPGIIGSSRHLKPVVH